jgi:uncharacterized membrane protein
LCSGFVVDECHERINVTSSLVLLALFVVLGEPLEGGVSGDVVGAALLLLGIAVDLGDDHVVISGEGVGDHLVVGGETLAVSAPLR